MSNIAKRYMTVIQFKADTPLPHLAKRVPGLQNFISGLTLQLRFLSGSESMGDHDSIIVDAGSVD
jgi:hypothetical protein